jgi:hypothetical protein
MTETFVAQNNVIRVRDTSGAVVFDTSTPMPHITNVINSTVSHSFPNSGATRFGIYFRTSQIYCEEYSFALQTMVRVDGYRSEEQSRVLAAETSQVYTLGTIPSGTNPDFIMVLLKANRTHAGAQNDYGNFVSAVAGNQSICGNGSTVLEAAFENGGAPWLSRIVSVFLDGHTVKAEFKHSNRQYTGNRVYANMACNFYPQNVAPLDATGSNWTVEFEIYVGKFTT